MVKFHCWHDFMFNTKLETMKYIFIALMIMTLRFDSNVSIMPSDARFNPRDTSIPVDTQTCPIQRFFPTEIV